MKQRIKICLGCLTKNEVKSKACVKCGQVFKKHSRQSLRQLLKNIILHQIYPDKS